MAVKVLNINQRIAKREKVIPRDIQEEVLKILNTNAILYGFYVSTWSERRVIKLLKERYGIKITGYVAKLLLQDRKDKKVFHQKNEENEFNEISELDKLGHDMFALYFFKIRIIDKREIEPFIGKEFAKDKLDVNLGIAIGKEEMYIKIIFSEASIDFKKVPFSEKYSKYLEVIRKDAVTSKANFIRDIIRSNTNKIIFVSKNDKFIERFNKIGGNALFYVIDQKKNDILLEYYNKYKEIEFIKSINNLSSKKHEEIKSLGKIYEIIHKELNKYGVEKSKVYNSF